MNDGFERQLRALRPAPMPASVRTRIAETVRSTSPLRRPAWRWLPVLAAAALVIAVIAVAQPVAERPERAVFSAEVTGYSLLLLPTIDPERLMEIIDRQRRPIPLFPAFTSDQSTRNDL